MFYSGPKTLDFSKCAEYNGGEEEALSSAPFWCTADKNDYKLLLEGEEQKYRPAEGMTWYDAVFFVML
ncbi:hypothetical protein [Treponema sp.]|uniref:hypothetical protein n=1 Tax=Treponema sp. TaxID=166 RepID=UPI00388E1590